MMMIIMSLSSLLFLFILFLLPRLGLAYLLLYFGEIIRYFSEPLTTDLSYLWAYG